MFLVNHKNLILTAVYVRNGNEKVYFVGEENVWRRRC